MIFLFYCSDEDVAGGARGPGGAAAVPAATHHGARWGLSPRVWRRAVHVQRDAALALPATGG